MKSSAPIGQQTLLGYLPATIIKNILSGYLTDDRDFPKHYTIQSVALFADISGFTKLSEGFSKKGRIGPEFLQFCLNRYMEQIINIIGTNGGDIFKFVGDAIMVVWPPENDNKSFLQDACRRAIQCALAIQGKLHNHKISKDKSLSVKIGIGVGECKILLVGGELKRCEYLCVGDAMKQACDSEGMAESGGQTIVSENVKKLVKDYYTLNIAKGNAEHPSEDKFYIVDPQSAKTKIKTKADAYLIRTKFSSTQIKEKFDLLKIFLPHAVPPFLMIEKEKWSREIRMVSIMFLNLKVDLSQIQGDDAFNKVQLIAKTVQRCIYRTHGSLNKFLMDDKGSVMLNVWGIPTFSATDDSARAVVTGITIVQELKKIGYSCVVGITTGTCFSGVCGTVGNRREYSLLGEVVNLSARFMGKGKEKIMNGALGEDSHVLVDEVTKNLIKNKIKCKYLFTSGLKGFSTDFNFFTPVEDDQFFPTQFDPFPMIRTHIDFCDVLRKDKKKMLKKNMTIIGNEKEQEIFISLMKKVLQNKGKKVIAVRGQMGVGKSLFIKSCLYELLSGHKELSKLYLNKENISAEEANPNFVLCSFQSPFTTAKPMNGFANILRYVYLQIKRRANLELEDFKFNNEFFTCDVIGEMIIQTKNISNIALIEDILSSDSEMDIKLSIHFSDETYEKIKKEISFKYFKSTTTSRQRDKFFQPIYEKSDYSVLCEFCRSLLVHYHSVLVNFHHYRGIPLILVIEDTHLIDKASVDFLNHFLSEDDTNLNPLLIIYSYQIPLSNALINDKAAILKESELMEEVPLNEILNDDNENNIASFQLRNLIKHKEIEKLIILNLEEKIEKEYSSTLKRVDKELIDIILRWSFNGIPLFIIDLINNLLDSKIYTQFLSEELDVTSELRDMEELIDWCEFKVPVRMEKICGEVIDSLSPKEIIILKHASVMGNLFDIEKLKSIIPFNNIERGELYEMLCSFQKKDIIDFLYDSHIKHKRVVCKFTFPFIREILYQRMLIEQRNNIHFAFSKLVQLSKFHYLPQKKEARLLEHQLEVSENSIMKQIQDDDETEMQKYLNQSRNNLNLTNLKITIVKNILEKLSLIQTMKDLEEGDEEFDLKNATSDEIKKMRYVIRSCRIEKKSDGKITWESRHFVITNEQICYYYNESEYRSGKVPLASFLLQDMISIEKMEDHSIGNKRNLFTVSVSRWIKKEIPQGPRTYFFSCKNREELYQVVITLNFLKVKAVHDAYCKDFGLLKFPLYKTEVDKKVKRKFNLNNDNNLLNSGIFEGLNDKKENNQAKKRFSTVIEFSKFNENKKYTEEDKKESLKHFKTMMKYSLSNMIGYIQKNLVKTLGVNDLQESSFNCELDTITIPKHLKTSHDPQNTSIDISVSKDSVSNENEENDHKKKIGEKNNITIDMLLTAMMDNSPDNKIAKPQLNAKEEKEKEKKKAFNSSEDISDSSEKNQNDPEKIDGSLVDSSDSSPAKAIERKEKMSFGNPNTFQEGNNGAQDNTQDLNDKKGNYFKMDSENSFKMGTLQSANFPVGESSENFKQKSGNNTGANYFTLQNSQKNNTTEGKENISFNNDDNNNSSLIKETNNDESTTNFIIEDSVVQKLKNLNLQIDNEEQYFLQYAQKTPSQNPFHTSSKEITDSEGVSVSNSPSTKNVFGYNGNTDKNSHIHVLSNKKLPKHKFDSNGYMDKFSDRKYKYIENGLSHNKIHVSNFFSGLKHK